MNIVDELLTTPGVIAAGTYSYKAEMSSFEGALSAEHARMLAVMCHASTKNMAMEAQMLADRSPRLGLKQARGWALRGRNYTLCAMADVFCMLKNEPGSFNKIMALLRQQLADADMEPV
jgi:roadblock/LC7 domain-containing protein